MPTHTVDVFDEENLRAYGFHTASSRPPAADYLSDGEVFGEDRGSAGRGIVIGLCIAAVFWFGFALGLLSHIVYVDLIA